MAEGNGNGGGEGGSNFGFLARKVGPLPVWAWAGLAVGGFYLWKARQSSTAPAAAQQAADQTGQPYQISQYAAAPKQVSYAQPTTVTQTATTPPAPAPAPRPAVKVIPKPKPKAKPRAHKRAPTPRSAHSPVTPRGGYRPRAAATPTMPGAYRPRVSSPPPASPPPQFTPAQPQQPAAAAGGQTANISGPPGPLVSTVQQAGIVEQPAYLDTSAQYQREPARVPTLVYPVVPSAPGQPPVSPPTETSPPVQRAYAPQTAGDVYASATG